jgi:MoaA/NifB/PqqE/SkfB family radical SAM enzyme
MQRKMALDRVHATLLFSPLVPVGFANPLPRTAPVSLFEDRRADILHVHLPASYNVCNFRCTYCYLPVYEARLPTGIVESLDRIIDRLKAVQRPLNIIFATDGEITIARELWPVLGRLTELPSLRLVSLFSNCSGNFEWILEHFPARKLSVIASCHLHQIETQARLDKFLQTVEMLRANIRGVVVSFILDPDQISRFPWLKQEMDQRGIATFAYPILQVEGKTRSYTADELARVTRLMRETNPAPAINDFMLEKTIPGLKCAAGRDYIQINNDGTVLACWKTGQVLGNILTDDPLHLLGADSVCPFGGCPCNWTAGFSDAVTSRFKRVNSLYNFIPRRPAHPPEPAFSIEDP